MTKLTSVLLGTAVILTAPMLTSTALRADEPAGPGDNAPPGGREAARSSNGFADGAYSFADWDSPDASHSRVRPAADWDDPDGRLNGPRDRAGARSGAPARMRDDGRERGPIGRPPRDGADWPGGRDRAPRRGVGPADVPGPNAMGSWQGPPDMRWDGPVGRRGPQRGFGPGGFGPRGPDGLMHFARGPRRGGRRDLDRGFGGPAGFAGGSGFGGGPEVGHFAGIPGGFGPEGFSGPRGPGGRGRHEFGPPDGRGPGSGGPEWARGGFGGPGRDGPPYEPRSFGPGFRFAGFQGPRGFDDGPRHDGPPGPPHGFGLGRRPDFGGPRGPGGGRGPDGPQRRGFGPEGGGFRGPGPDGFRGFPGPRDFGDDDERDGPRGGRGFDRGPEFARAPDAAWDRG